MKIRQLFLMTVLIVNSLLPLMSVRADTIENPQAATSRAEETIDEPETTSQEAAAVPSVTFESENKTKSKASEHRSTNSEKVPLQKAAGIVEVSDSESFVAAWNNPDTQKIIVTESFDYGRL